MRRLKEVLRKRCGENKRRTKKPPGEILLIGVGGGAEGTRTPDFLLAKEALSRLSYSPRLPPKL